CGSTKVGDKDVGGLLVPVPRGPYTAAAVARAAAAESASGTELGPLGLQKICFLSEKNTPPLRGLRLPGAVSSLVALPVPGAHSLIRLCP
uniref:Uncharacterized protein n=1 Tax=Cricetulus griseus TaxID=10029 RepID=A0A8C2MQE2_CRIGR